MSEIWKDVEDYEGLYQVSNMGKVKSLDYRHTGEERNLKTIKDRYGYLQIKLWKNRKGKRFLVHRLVAMTFIPNPENKPCIDHINTIKDDNRVDNLKWATAKENSNNVLTRSKRSGANSKKARKLLQFTKEGVFVKEWSCIMDVERELGFDNGNISACCSGKLKTSYNFVWKYAE